jgi:DNA-binding IclR family transcriptional regulator
MQAAECRSLLWTRTTLFDALITPLVRPVISSQPRDIPATVLPIRGGQAHVPAARLVRVALAGVGELDRNVLRAAIAVVEALAEQGRGGVEPERFWWERPVAASVTGLAARTGLLAAEVEAGLEVLCQSGALDGTPEDGWRISPDVLCEEPALASLDWTTIRERLGRSRARLAPAAAILRELVRISPVGDLEAPVAVRIGELTDSSLYGRSAVTNALADLEKAGLITRAAATTRQGVRLRLSAVLQGREEGAAASTSESGAVPQAPEASDDYVEEIMFGRHRIEVPADATLRIVSRNDGGSRVELGPLVIESSPDGMQVATCGGLRITRRPRV